MAACCPLHQPFSSLKWGVRYICGSLFIDMGIHGDNNIIYYGTTLSPPGFQIRNNKPSDLEELIYPLSDVLKSLKKPNSISYFHKDFLVITKQPKKANLTHSATDLHVT